LSIQPASQPKTAQKIHPHRWLVRLIKQKKAAEKVVNLRFATHPDNIEEPNQNLILPLQGIESVTLFGPTCDRRPGKAEYELPADVDVTIFYRSTQWHRRANCTVAVVQDPAKTWQISIRGDGTMERLDFTEVNVDLDLDLDLDLDTCM
jgi:hypothetical protein